MWQLAKCSCVRRRSWSAPSFAVLACMPACFTWLRVSGIVRGYYHQEWNCNYSDHSFTNKSVAYAESHDGGRSFQKPDYPSNSIILPPRGNTTSRHQTGEGDHTGGQMR